MKTGQIKRKMDKGYGFIQGDNKEYFFHSTQCVTPFDDLNEGDNIQFNTEESPKGLRAVDVEKV